MAGHHLFVRLGPDLYRVERPWGELAPDEGAPSDISCDAAGRVFCLLRRDPYADPPGPAVVVLAPDGRRIGAWGGGDVADGHMLSVHSAGGVFVVDRDAHEVVVFGADEGAARRPRGRHRPGEPLNAPCDVCFGPDGSIYVADGYGASLVHRLSAAGTPLGAWAAAATLRARSRRRTRSGRWRTGGRRWRAGRTTASRCSRLKAASSPSGTATTGR